MGAQSSNKRGLQSSARKSATSRHGIAPQPSTAPVAGAFGGGGTEQPTPVSAGPLERRSKKPRRSGRLRAVGPVGISNLSPAQEEQEQRRVPPRGTRKGR